MWIDQLKEYGLITQLIEKNPEVRVKLKLEIEVSEKEYYNFFKTQEDKLASFDYKGYMSRQGPIEEPEATVLITHNKELDEGYEEKQKQLKQLVDSLESANLESKEIAEIIPDPEKEHSWGL